MAFNELMGINLGQRPPAKPGQPTLQSGAQTFFTDPKSSKEAFMASVMPGMMGAYQPAGGKITQQLAGRADGADGGYMGEHGYAQYNQGDGFNKGSGKFDVFSQSGDFSHTDTFQDPNKGVAQWGPIAVGLMAGAGAMGYLGGGSAVGAGSGAVGSGAGFVGEGALSGVPSWDLALTNAPSWQAGAAGAAGAANGSWDVPGTVGGTGGLPAGSPPANPLAGGGGAAGAGAGGAASGGGGMSGKLAEWGAKLGLSPADMKLLAPIVASAAGGLGGGGMPSVGGGSTNQSAEARQFLDAVLPAIRTDSVNPYGSGRWIKDANGKWTLTTELNGANQGIYDSATGKLGQLAGGLNPNEVPPELLDSVGGQYQSNLAKTIFDRTMGMQATDIERERQKMHARLVEQGFVPGNQGYVNEMKRWEEGLGEMRNKASMDAQIAAATQALNEGKFTNDSRNQSWKNTLEGRESMASLLAGLRKNTTDGLNSLTTQASAPTGNPGSATSAAQLKYNSDLAAYQDRNAQINDIIRALMNWGA